MKKTLILGIGSVLRGDDAIGIRTVEALEKQGLPEEVSVKAGDISGLDILKYFPGYDDIVIVDAADMGEEPGTIKVFDPSNIRKASFNDKFSTHGMALLLMEVVVPPRFSLPQVGKTGALAPEGQIPEPRAWRAAGRAGTQKKTRKKS